MTTSLRSAFITTNPEESIVFDTFVDANGGIANKVFPPKPVDKAETKIFQIDASKMKEVNDEKGTADEKNKVEENGFYKTITMKEFGLGKDLNPRNRRDADAPAKVLFEVPRAIKIITQNLLMRMERRASTLARTAANYPTALKTSLSSGDRFDDGGSIQAKRIAWNNALMDSCGMKANAIAMDQKAYDRLWLNEELMDRTKFTGGGPIPLEIIKQFFQVEHVFVGNLRTDASPKGIAKSMGTYWGADLLAFVHNPSPAKEDVSYGHTFLLEQPFKVSFEPSKTRKGMAGPMETVEVYAEYALDKGIIESESSNKFAAGYLVQNAFTIS